MQKRKIFLFLSFSQITLLVFSIFAFAFFVGEFRLASSQEQKSSTLLGNDGWGGPPWLPGEGPENNDGQQTSEGGIGGIVSGLFKGESCGNFGSLCAGAAWGLTLGFVVKFAAGFFGADQALEDALFKSVFIGSVAGGGAANLVTSGVIGTGGKVSILGTQVGAQGFGTIVGLGVGVAVFLLTYKKESKKAVQFQCLPFEPPLGGSACERCNEDPMRPCSEYRCRSLGQACQLVNKGTEEESCVWVGRDDVNPPTITPWEEPLTEGHSYSNHDTLPPSLGAKITRDNSADGCLQAFTPLEFGINLNEPGQCKIDFEHKESYEEMTFFFGESNFYRYNHTQKMALPSPDSLKAESPELENDGVYNLYARCRDANGNTNVQEFVFNFCVDPSPDTTPPTIVDTSIQSGSPVSFNSDSVDLEVYVNEPAECKWSVEDKNYDLMENQMSCSTAVGEINAQLLYTCATTLTGVQNNALNEYYFRCKDQPSKPDNERNVNVQSYEFNLQGTQPLNIIDVSPEENETITGSTSTVNLDLRVETSNGADEGKSICYFSDTGEEGSYITMFETNSFEHRQTLSLTGGDYTYYFRCVDAGGNSDEANTSFNVFVDTQAPMITRAYRDLDALKIVTDENAQCVYSLNSCNYDFDEGLNMIYSNPSIRTSHFAEWEANRVYYIKCRDDFGNEPSPNACSLVASATNIG